MIEIPDLCAPANQFQSFGYADMGVRVVMTSVPIAKTVFIPPEGQQPELIVVARRLDNFHAQEAGRVVYQVRAAFECCSYVVAHAVGDGKATEGNELFVVSSIPLVLWF